MEEHASFSERPEDQLKVVEWTREQKKKILDNKICDFGIQIGQKKIY